MPPNAWAMLQSNNRAIEEQRADLQGMVSDISHQVKTPVTNLKIAATTLLEQELQTLTNTNGHTDNTADVTRQAITAATFRTAKNMPTHKAKEVTAIPAPINHKIPVRGCRLYYETFP